MHTNVSHDPIPKDECEEPSLMVYNKEVLPSLIQVHFHSKLAAAIFDSSIVGLVFCHLTLWAILESRNLKEA